MSEMAPLHNFSEREQKESEGKWKARKEGVCNLYLRRWGLASACFFCFFYFCVSAEFLFFKEVHGSRSETKVLPRRSLWVDLVVTRGAKKGQTRRPTHTRPLCRGVHTLVGRQSSERECEVRCYLWSTGCRWEENDFKCSCFWTSLQTSAAVVCFFSPTLFTLLVSGKSRYEALNLLPGGWSELPLQHGAEGYDYHVR